MDRDDTDDGDDEVMAVAMDRGVPQTLAPRSSSRTDQRIQVAEPPPVFDPPGRPLRRGTHIELDTLYEMERKRKRNIGSSSSTTGLELPVPLIRADKIEASSTKKNVLGKLDTGRGDLTSIK